MNYWLNIYSINTPKAVFYVLLGFYIFMFKHQKKSKFKSLEAVYSMKEKRQNPYYPAAATVYSSPLCNPQIMVRLLIFGATSGNKHSQ